MYQLVVVCYSFDPLLLAAWLFFSLSSQLFRSFIVKMSLSKILSIDLVKEAVLGVLTFEDCLRLRFVSMEIANAVDFSIRLKYTLKLVKIALSHCGFCPLVSIRDKCEHILRSIIQKGTLDQTKVMCKLLEKNGNSTIFFSIYYIYFSSSSSSSSSSSLRGTPIDIYSFLRVVRKHIILLVLLPFIRFKKCPSLLCEEWQCHHHWRETFPNLFYKKICMPSRQEVF